MFLAFREHVGGGKLLPVLRVVISDWESRDFGGDVFSAPKENVIESRCASSVVRCQLIYLCHRNVPQDGLSISQHICAVRYPTLWAR